MEKQQETSFQALPEMQAQPEQSQAKAASEQQASPEMHTQPELKAVPEQHAESKPDHKHSHEYQKRIHHSIQNLTFLFTFALYVGAVAAAIYTKEPAISVWNNWVKLQTSPCPLVTDYFMLGSLASAFLNAAICGTVCTLFTFLPDSVKYKPNVWAGYFLVIAHCFYGLNLVNMMMPMVGFYIYVKRHGLRFRDNLDWAMFITSFGPFFSELLFRYPSAFHWSIRIGSGCLHLYNLFLCVLLSIFVGIVLPPMLPGTAKLHRGFNLYNGGLATGLLGLFIYAFMYKTMGRVTASRVELENAVYEAHGYSYLPFMLVFFVILFGICLLFGWYHNGKSFKGYKELLQDSGHKTNFLLHYGIGPTWINLGIYGLMMTAYFALVISLTNGAGFTGATVGVTLAAMTFSASGQHPKNVWPILVGYAALSLLVTGICTFEGREIPWSLSTQGYMNGIAFATGLCPFAGTYGIRVGILAGFISAVMCTTTSVMHGGFVLYNGGLNAGITALILLPLIDTYHLGVEDYARKK